MSDTAAQLAVLFQKAPALMCVLRGPEHVLELANECYYELVGRRDMVGKPLLDALPEIRDQGFKELLDQVLDTGVPFVGRELPAMLARTPGAPPERRYVTFIYQPLTEPDGTRSGIFVHGNDVTQEVEARREIERLLADSRRAHDALAHANEQLEAQQIELGITNEQLQQNALEVETQADELQVTIEELAEQTAEAEAALHRATFSGAIGRAITGGGTLGEMMQRCCQAAVDHLDAAFCRVWVHDADEAVLVLTASAGMYTHLDGPHGRVPVGQFKIGQIAASRQSLATNSVASDPRVDQVWARREGMVAFAGHPLVVDEEMVGVFAMFAQQPIDEGNFETFATGATAISVAVSNARLFASERRAREVAEAANRSKSEFLAVMSHELRTPLNAIDGYAELLEIGVRGKLTDEQRLDIQRIRRSQRHLLGLINGVLNYAKVDAGAVHYVVEDVHMDEVLLTCEALVAPQIRTKKLDFDHSGFAGGVTARADREKVQQIAINLLSNAVKFTEPGGRVTLDCLREGDDVVVVVSDTGPGIAEDQVERVFQPFVQLDAKLTRAQEGTGLGLAISRDLARGMGGDITVESTLGKGSVFTLRLRGSSAGASGSST